MRQHERIEVRPRTPGRTRRRGTFLAGLAVASLLVSACAGGGATTAPAGSAAATPSGAASQPATGSYPNRTINFVVPFNAGGPTDTVTRLIAEPMGKTLGQQIVVQNVGGAGGTLGAGQVATAAKDGYTVLMHHIGMSTAPALYKDLPFKPLEDFRTIGLVTDVPMTIVGKKDLPPGDLKALIDYVKANKDTLTYAHAGPGAASHLCGLLFMQAVGVKVTEVPYTGTGPAMTDLVGGQVDFMCDQTTNTTGQIKDGAIKGYAVTTKERNAALPDLPTAAEGGLPNFEVTVWHGLYVPKDTPDEVVQKLNAALKAALKDQNVVTKFAELGTAPVPEDQVTPEAHTERLRSQLELWKPILEASGATAP